MRAGATLPVAGDRRAILGGFRCWPKKEELMERELALEDVSLGETGDPLDVRRRQDLAVQNERFDVRRVSRDRLHDRVTEGFALGVGPTTRDAVRRVLYENTH